MWSNNAFEVHTDAKFQSGFKGVQIRKSTSDCLLL